MEFYITLAASLATIFGFVYMLFFGSKSFFELLSSIPSRIMIWRRTKKKTLATLSGRVTSVSVSHDAKSYAFGGFDQCLHIVVVEKGKEHRFLQHTGTIRTIIHVPVSGDIISSGDDGLIYSVDRALVGHRIIGFHDSPVYALYIHNGQNLILAGDKAGKVLAWEMNQSPWFDRNDSIQRSSNVSRLVVNYPLGSVFAICGNNSSSVVYVSGVDGLVLECNVASRSVTTFAMLEKTVFSLAYDDLTDTLYAGCSDGRIGCVKRTPSQIEYWNGHTDAVRWLALDEKKRRLYSASKDKTIRSWHLSDPKRSIVGKHDDYVYQISLSADGRALYSAGGDGKIILWAIE